MLSDDLLSRVTNDKNILNGKPIIRGMRISISMISELLAKGADMKEILEDYPMLEEADIHAALAYASLIPLAEESVE